MDAQSLRKGQSTTFSHSEEVASPGYYAVRLPKLGVLAELTATPRVGVHRYTFSAERLPHLILDVMNALGGRRSTEGMVRVLPEAKEVEGSVKTFGTFSGAVWGHQGVFRGQFSQPLASFATWQDEWLPRDKPPPRAIASALT